jgi:hypothetical protein
LAFSILSSLKISNDNNFNISSLLQFIRGLLTINFIFLGALKELSIKLLKFNGKRGI